jgi:hypothetical protein
LKNLEYAEEKGIKNVERRYRLLCRLERLMEERKVKKSKLKKKKKRVNLNNP